MPFAHRSWLLAAALLASAPATAEELAIPPANYPSLAATAPNTQAFVPAGWRLERTAEGDLNGDGRPDLAFVLRATDPGNILTNQGLGESRFDTNPRILALAFALPGGGFRLVLADHRLIPRRTDPVQEDPFDPQDSEMKIAGGALQIGLYRFMSAGGADAGQTRFSFRWRDGALRLVGFDFGNVQRMTGATADLSIDYLTRRMKISIGRIDRDGQRVQWKDLPARPLLRIDQIGDGLDFDPDGAIEKLP